MNTLIYHLQRYDKRYFIKNIDKEYILKFIKYLSTANQEHSRKRKLSANTQVCYFKGWITV